MINFREITKENYLEVTELKVDERQRHFVADNTFSLVQASYEEGLNTRAIYKDETLIGFLLFDYDEDIKNWSLSRFMIDVEFQGKGYGKEAVKSFFDYAKNNFKIEKLYISVSIDNLQAANMFRSLGFVDVKKVSYTLKGHLYNEIQMLKNL